MGFAGHLSNQLARMVNVLWITAANILYLISYSVRDILWLRVLTIGGALLLIPYYWQEPGHLKAAIGWNVLFIAINTVWVVILLLERRPVRLTGDEARLREMTFPSLSEREAQKLFNMGVWEDVAPGTSLVDRDTKNAHVSVIFYGVADVISDAVKIAELGEGQFIGAIDLHAARLNLDVVAREPVRILSWPSESLRSYLRGRPDVGLSLSRSAGREMRELLGKALSQF